MLSDPPAPKACYLWTLTFPDALTRGDPRLAMKRWDSFRKWLDKTGKLGVRALERGEKGAFHFHVATPQWWDAREMWDAGDRYGFGRVNVRERPIAAAYYLAKYVGKGTGRKWLPRGMRQWGCFGFKGVSAQNLRWTEKARVVVPNAYDGKLFDVLVWKVDDAVAFTQRLRAPHAGADEIKTMELKPAQVKEIVSKLVSGVICVVGEFRGVSVRTQAMTDNKTNTKVERVLVEAAVELGGKAVTVTEWTKPGTKETEVKLTQIQRGEPCLIQVESVKWFAGHQQISGVVRALPALV
jgi:hypothetical protein